MSVRAELEEHALTSVPSESAIQMDITSQPSTHELVAHWMLRRSCVCGFCVPEGRPQYRISLAPSFDRSRSPAILRVRYRGGASERPPEVAVCQVRRVPLAHADTLNDGVGPVTRH